MLDSENPTLAELYAEDLLRGYRLDVFEERTGQWRSLHRRVGTYATPGAPGAIPAITDEGFVQLGVTGSARPPGAPPDPGQELYVHESLFTWNGWSLSAPHPSKSISRDARAPTKGQPDTDPQRVMNTAMTRLGLETSFKVEAGTLPRLRFGERYRLRIRTVDLAGNGPTLEEATQLQAVPPPMDIRPPLSEELLYRRFEPVNPPALVPRQLYSPNGKRDGPDATAFAEGESLERLVIRSNFDQSTDEYAAAHPSYQPMNERHVAAPKASLQLVETHGLLDGALDAKNAGLPLKDVRAWVKQAYDLACREAGSLSDTKGMGPAVRFVPTGEGQGYAVHTEEQLLLPYLPDPWAAGVIFEGLPGMAPDQQMPIPFDAPAWPDAPPFRLRLTAGDGPPTWDKEKRVLTVQLAQAGIAHVRVRSRLGGPLDTLGLWQWLREAANADPDTISADKMVELEHAIKESRHWMVTPFRDLTLVHAVQQPRAQPRLVRLEVVRRDESCTAAYLGGDIDLDAVSTSKIDLLAAWSEPRDDPALGDPDTVHARAHVLELPTTLDDGQPVSVDYHGTALNLQDNRRLFFDSWQAKYARDELQRQLDPTADLALEQRGRSRSQLSFAGKVSAHEFGDTKYRRVTYHVTTTTRFREYFASSITDHPSNLTRASEPTTLDILSAARPAPPRIAYVLPTFGWEHEDGAEAITSTRRGGGVRVYLDRPWWSSGDGELLGVVLGQQVPNPSEPLYSRLTYWGQDPLWQSPSLPLPTPAAFMNANPDQTVARVRLGDLPDMFVTVVGFEVTWDSNRKLWYVDLDLNTADAYHPFVRLALARFQPRSLFDPHNAQGRDLRLSPVVLADFVQPVPNRSVTVTRDPAAPLVFGVAVTGVTYTARAGLPPMTSHVEVLIQRRLPDIEDEVIGWSDLLLTFDLAPDGPNLQGIVVWKGQVNVPGEHVGERLRLVVQEFETLSVAADKGFIDGKRVIYVDTINL